MGFSNGTMAMQRISSEYRKQKMKQYPWWRKDRRGYPVEYIKNKPIRNLLRTICQNIKKPFCWLLKGDANAKETR